MRNDQYFNWLCGQIDADGNYNRLFSLLDSYIFTYTMRMDANREADGHQLRIYFCDDYSIDYYEFSREMDNPFGCSVFEMMVALAERTETIVYDPDNGNCVGVWFNQMLYSLGLYGMIDARFDENKARAIIENFLERRYAPNGKGGLFTVDDPRIDMRRLEIWDQMDAYIRQIERR